MSIPAAEPTPPEGRFYSIVGGACIAFGIYYPACSILHYGRIWDFIQRNGGFGRAGPYHLAGFVDVLLQGVISVAAGWGLFRRRSWAPAIACAAGGALLVDVGCTIRSEAAKFASLVGETLRSKPFNPDLTAWGKFLVYGAHALLWLVVLGAMFLERRRHRFPPGRVPFTTRTVWSATGAGAAVSLLMWGAWLWIYKKQSS